MLLVSVFVQVKLLGTGTRYDIDILKQFGKRAKTKSQKILRGNCYFGKVTGGKLVRGAGGRGRGSLPHPILNRVI